MKTCNKCNRLLSLSSFTRHSGATYLRPECRECNNQLSRDRKTLRKEFGDAPEGYVCPICLKTADQLVGKAGNAGVWVLDHNHSTRSFRGYLCHGCNRGIGSFQDDVAMLERAIAYLKETNGSV